MNVWVLGVYVYRHLRPNANVVAVLRGIGLIAANVPLAVEVELVPILPVVVAVQRVDRTLDGNASLCQCFELGCVVVATG